MENPNASEKRHYPRLPKTLQIEVRELTYPVESGPPQTARIKDISGNGICFVSDCAFEPGKVLCLTIHIKGWEMFKKPHSVLLDMSEEAPLNIIGEVVWAKAHEVSGGHEVGIKFLDVYEDDHRALLQYLNDFFSS